MQDAETSLGVTGRFLESEAETDYDANINPLFDGDCEVVITLGFQLGDATKTAAQANPDQRFSIVDFAYDPPVPNILGQVDATEEAAVLAGYHPQAQGKIAPSRQIASQSPAGQWMAPDPKEPHPAGKRLPAR